MKDITIKSGFQLAKDASSVKKLDRTIQFSFQEFCDFELFNRDILSVLNEANKYSILCRIGYVKNAKNNKPGNVKKDLSHKAGKDKNRVDFNKSKQFATDWKLLGRQIPIMAYSQQELEDSVVNLHQVVCSFLEDSMDYYNYNSSQVVVIQVIVYYVGVKTPKRIKQFSVTSLGSRKDLINIRDTSVGFNKYIPLQYKKKDLGFPLKKNVKKGYISSIVLQDGTIINIVKTINKNLLSNQVENISSKIDFYQKQVGPNTILISSEKLANTSVFKVFNLAGLQLQTITDEKLTTNSYVRQVGNVKGYINKKGIYKKEVCSNFNHIHPFKVKGLLSRMIQPEWRIGSMDIETYSEGPINKTYAMGFYVKDSVKTFYIDSDLDSDKLIIKCLNEMLTEKYAGYTFYVHNFSKYDVFFLLRVIIKLASLQPETYKHKPYYRDNDIIGLDISRKIKKKTYTIHIKDSYNLLQGSLDELCKTFNTEVKKSYFPHKFVTKNTMFYIGDKPAKKYYINETYKYKQEVLDNTLSVDYDNRGQLKNAIYKKISKENWNLKENCIKYLEKDLISLYQVMDKLNSQIFIKYHTHITNSLTISSLSMEIFLRRFYANNIPLINKRSVYSDIKESYYGGVTEVYRPYGKNLYYYDVNSLYPYSALNPMPGLKSVFDDEINKDISDIKKDLFGFFYCSVVSSEGYLGLLPFRSDKGLIMPLGSFEGWYFSEELKYAHEQGYKIKVLYGYSFEKSFNVFDKYVEHLYQIKSTTTNQVEKTMVKSLLNNLLGRFGLDINKYVTNLVSRNELNEILKTREIKSINYIEDKILVTYDSEVSQVICEKNGLDYKEVYRESMEVKGNKPFKVDRLNNVSVAISSAVTSYARIYMNKIKLDIINKGGKIFYTDTDSIVTNIKLNNSLVGTALGQFKLEHEIQEGYFISNKTYAIKTKQDKIIKVSKGHFYKSLSYDDYVNMFQGKPVESIKYGSKKDYTKGSVVLYKADPMTLRPESYTKRIKLFKGKNRWIDTKPLNISKYHTNSRETNRYLNLEPRDHYYLFVLDLNHIHCIITVSFICFLYCVALWLTAIKVEIFLVGLETINCDPNGLQVSLESHNIDSIVDVKVTSRNTLLNYNYKDYNLAHMKDVNKDSFPPVACRSSSIQNKLSILDKVKQVHLEESIQEIEKLNKENSLLKHSILQHRIERLDLNREIDSIIKILDPKGG